MRGEWLTLLVPLLVTGVIWLLMKNPGRRPCGGWNLSDGLRCWRDWIRCRLHGGGNWC